MKGCVSGACGAHSSGNLGRADRRHRVPFLALGHQTICPKLQATRPPEARGYSGGTAFAKCCSRAMASLSGDGEDLDAMNYVHALFEPFVEKIHPVCGKACEDAGALQRRCQSD